MAQNREFRGVARRRFSDSEGEHFAYHSTTVLSKLADGRVRLNSGGWTTNTTKLAINQAANELGLHISVVQKDGAWSVRGSQFEINFHDGMTFYPDTGSDE